MAGKKYEVADLTEMKSGKGMRTRRFKECGGMMNQQKACVIEHFFFQLHAFFLYLGSTDCSDISPLIAYINIEGIDSIMGHLIVAS